MSEVKGPGGLIFRVTDRGVEITRELSAFQDESFGVWDWAQVVALAKMAPPAPKKDDNTS